MEYSTSHVKRVIYGIGLDKAGETGSVFLCFCPLHDNRHTPAFAVNKHTGTWICFNESCGRSGSLVQLVQVVTGRTRPEAERYIGLKKGDDDVDVEQRLHSIFNEEEEEWLSFPKEYLEAMLSNFWKSEEAKEYMYDRGFTNETLRHFEVGFSPRRGDIVTVPVHSPDGRICVGVVGRTIEGKRFDNSSGLPRSRVLWNLHRARREYNDVVIVESIFDAMKIHQAGFPNVVASLGSSISDQQVALLERNFDTIIVMADNDSAGLAMREKIVNSVSLTNCLHSATGRGTLYPEAGIDGGVPKDAGDLSDDQIKEMINNAITTAEWKLSA